MNEETITITKAEYERIVRAACKMQALEEIGVDNWDGYCERHDAEKDLLKAYGFEKK